MRKIPEMTLSNGIVRFGGKILKYSLHYFSCLVPRRAVSVEDLGIEEILNIEFAWSYAL